MLYLHQLESRYVCYTIKYSLLQLARNTGVDFAVAVLFNTAHSGSLGTVRRAGTVHQVQDQIPALNNNFWPFYLSLNDPTNAFGRLRVLRGHIM